MFSTPEPFIRAEIDYRHERMRASFAASAERRAARRIRREPASRRAAGHLPGRLVTGS